MIFKSKYQILCKIIILNVTVEKFCILCTQNVEFLMKLTMITNQLTPWNRVILEKLLLTQLVKKLPALYGTQKLTTMFIGPYPETQHESSPHFPTLLP